MAEVLVRDLDASVVEKLKACATANGRSLQAELKAILEAQASQVTKAEARAAGCSRPAAHRMAAPDR
jgi:plasmid stability protein